MSLENSCANPAFPLPIGCIMPYMGLAQYVPPTFLICDGRTLSKVDYPELYKRLGSTFNGTATVADGSFLLPKINDTDTFLVPNGTLKTDPTRANGILSPTLHSSDVLPALSAANIPVLLAANFTPSYPTDQVGLTGRTLNARGDYKDPSRYYATDSTGASNPPIVKANSSNESGGFATLNTADYIYKNDVVAPIGDIVLNEDHSVQYGGMTCIYIIKAFSSYTPSASKNASINATAERAAAYVAEVAGREAAVVVATDTADAENDARAADEAAAIAADGAGGGTVYPFAGVEQLEGFRMPPNNNY